MLKLIYNFFSYIKNKINALLLVFCFFVLSFDRLEHCIEINSNFEIGNWSEPGSVPRTAEVDECENYLKQLNNVLFFEKHDGELVKQLLLWGADKSPDSYGKKINLLRGSLASVVSNNVQDKSMQILNYYRLAFYDAYDVRSYIYYRFRSLLIKNEQQFQQTLVNMVDLYKTRYPCDEADSKKFQELINYEWTDQDIKYSDFSKIKY